MHFNKKGDLAISTNAIVVLIIAVIMLGLIIAFVQQGFGTVSDKFFGQVESLPDPDVPTAGNPITTSETTIVHPGEQFGMKIAVYGFNPAVVTTTGATPVKPLITCLSGTPPTEQVIDAASVQVSPRAIVGGDVAVFTYIAEAKTNARLDKNLCQLTVVNADNSVITSGAPVSDIILEVRE